MTTFILLGNLSVKPSVRGYVMSRFGKVKSSEKPLAFIGEIMYFEV
jgi:hypothetical protein